MIVGLTGGIGSGKSTVLQFFVDLGVKAFIADIEAKKLMNSNTTLISEIKNLFGEEAYLNKELNRPFIAKQVFKDKVKLEKLNALVHPKVKEHFLKFAKANKSEIIIYEAAILFESGSAAMCDYIITVTANLDERIARVATRDNVSKEQILARINNQISDSERVKKSNFVIENQSLNNTKIQVKAVFDILLKLK